MMFDTSILRQCWFLAGPTACGKTSAGLLLAQTINAEIIALDSMSLYRGMDIGTAKPTREEQAMVPHHLIDILDPHEEYTVAEYLPAAEQAAIKIIERGKTPLFVGGTGLYLRSVLRGVFEGPAADWEFRNSLEAAAAEHPPGWLHNQLHQVDPVSAERLHPADTRRLIRALEIVYLTGQPASIQQQQEPLPEHERPQNVFWLHPSREDLYQRINQRVDRMMEQGLLHEVRSLLTHPQGLSRTARQALGYKEIIDHLEGRWSLSEAVEQIKTKTRQFAKRQHTWFRNLVECREVTCSGECSPERWVERILDR